MLPFISRSLPASVFLLETLAAILLIQAAGQYLNYSLVAESVPLGAGLSALLTFGYFSPPTKANLSTLGLMLILFAALGIGSCSLWDFSYDGMGYQQPGAEALLAGYNPLHHNADMLWLNIFPSGAWELEAALGWLFGSIEAAKMLQLLWLMIALPLLLSGLICYFNAALSRRQTFIALLMVLSPIVLSQWLTHYVDAMIYLAGISFFGALGLYGHSKRGNQLALLLMGSCVLFMVNAKLSGIYHAVVWCGCAVLYAWHRTGKLPLREAVFLMGAGLVAVLFLGFHPYITNLQTYGSLLHTDSSTFTGFQRPANLNKLSPPARFLYSVFSTTTGEPRLAAVLKYPWVITAMEWVNAGVPDSRTGGFGVLFALVFCLSLPLLLLARGNIDRRLMGLALILLLSSMLFPEGWWARYVPFAYMFPLLLLLALPASLPRLQHVLASGMLILLTANALIHLNSNIRYFERTNAAFLHAAAVLKQQPEGNVYLVPPGDDYLIYNHAHKPLQRRLAALGIASTVRVDAPCERKAAEMYEFKLCY